VLDGDDLSAVTGNDGGISPGFLDSAGAQLRHILHREQLIDAGPSARVQIAIRSTRPHVRQQVAAHQDRLALIAELEDRSFISAY
jgi:hypothetical protein